MNAILGGMNVHADDIRACSHVHVSQGLDSFFSFELLLQDIGGNDIQKQEIKEAVELPLTHHELYRQIGIDPPRGVLLWGPPGTGKTMLAKAVAHHTTAAFIRVVGSEFVQKYLGEVCSALRLALPSCYNTRVKSICALGGLEAR